MPKMMLQRILLLAGVIALVVVLIDGTYSIAATIPGKTPVRVDHVTAGPYHLAVSMYTYPANAGFALPFAVAPEQAIDGALTFHINSLPGPHVDANPVRATFSADPKVRNGVQGAAEITVQGPWTLQIQVDGPAGQGVANVPVAATALPPMPTWLGWFLGFIPFYVLITFLLVKYFIKPKRAPQEESLQTDAPEDASEMRSTITSSY
ncbi:hypothetical protein [Ktedonobacter racemifer]|uniref:Uncharacterized protein n=1 Tax=Ktedonobacter racemifer DSM 44963 TaxID=485913 RepID=D6TG15_KTERA|nr:hypothetical protein [Ktedonobacter racemifer]EFH88717.1 hypothetical protein Krac_10206 [Ktedonobacter racemifer DSM 44963]